MSIYLCCILGRLCIQEIYTTINTFIAIKMHTSYTITKIYIYIFYNQDIANSQKVLSRQVFPTHTIINMSILLTKISMLYIGTSLYSRDLYYNQYIYYNQDAYQVYYNQDIYI